MFPINTNKYAPMEQSQRGTENQSISSK